jgi:acetylornithine deacetylase/succinyl-diaminopimelate desuccinylase family protein
VEAAAAGDDAAQLLRQLIRIPSPNPPGDTREVADVVRQYLEAAGIAVEMVGPDETRPCVIARLGDSNGPILGFNSHIDTVGTGSRGDWTRDPFGGELADGRIWGRGAGDAKASVAAMCVAAKLLHQSRESWSGGVLLALVSDEETGGNGSRFLLANGHTDADAWVIGEMTGNRVAIAEKGLIWLRIETLGRTAHSSTPEKGVSAIEKMLDLLQRIRIELVPAMQVARHPLTPPGSLNIGLIQGGVQPNMVADRCSVVLDRRLLPNERPEAFEADVRRLLSELSEHDTAFRARVETLLVGPSIETDPKDPLVVAIRDASVELGIADEPIGFDQSCDGRFYSELGIPTVILGPGDPGLAHTAREHVVAEDLVVAVNLYAGLAKRYLLRTGKGGRDGV